MTSPADMAQMMDGLERVQRTITQVLQNAARQRVELTQKTDEQITQMETQAARMSLPPWEQAQQQIVDEYQQRVQKATDELNRQLTYERLTASELRSIWSQYYRTIEADAQMAAAQMQKQMQQLRDQVAGQLQSLFDNPAKYLENRAKQMAMDIAANMVTALMQKSPEVGGAIGGLLGLNKMGTQTNPVDALKQMFHPGGVAGAPGAGGAAGSALISAGSTLTSAGMTLSSSSTMLASAAQQLQAAASMMTGRRRRLRWGHGRRRHWHERRQPGPANQPVRR